MRALKNLQKDAMKLQKEVEIAELVLQGAEEELKSNPSQETWDALEEAELNYKRANELYDSCMSFIRNYDFYRECEKQEKLLEERREVYYQYC